MAKLIDRKKQMAPAPNFNLIRWKKTMPRCPGKQGAGLLLGLAAGSSRVAFAEATLTPMCEAVGSTKALLHVGPVTPPLQFHPDGKSGVGIQLQPRGSKSLYKILPQSLQRAL